MSTLALAVRQIRYENLAFWRNPAAAFFTFAFPLLFMVIFNVLFGGSSQDAPPGLSAADFFTPGIIAFSVITATFTNMAMNITFARDAGILKRVRGTPLPPVAFLGGRIAHAALIALVLTVIVAAIGALLYYVAVPWGQLPVLIVVLVVGAATFCALGLALTGFIPNADAAPAIVNAAILPLLFISNVFIQMNNAPEWLDTVSRIFPVRHFADALMGIYSPELSGVTFQWTDVGVVALWGVAGVLIALRTFSWEPRR
jgi:ABC-2 type transport system permease protein